MRVDDRYRVLWFADTDEVAEEDVIALWTAQAGLPRDVAEARISELACVALEDDAGLVGVSTAYLDRSEQLRAQMWHYRTFVGEGHRHENLARALLVGTTEVLQDRYVAGEDTRAAGMVMQIENEGLKRRWNRGVWHDPRVVEWDGRKWPWPFIADGPHAEHVRVHWFPGAQAPLPGS